MITIRKSRPDDIEVLADFQRRLAAESENIQLDKPVVRKGLQALFDDPAKGIYYLAESEGEVVGCHLITYEWSDWRNGMVWWLQSVYVVESHRKQGVFKQMYQNLMNILNSDPNVIGLRLYVDKSNFRAQQVYSSMGMNGDHYTVFEKMKN